MVRQRDREAYEQGLRDSEKGIFEEFVSDSVGAATDLISPEWDEQQEAAYWKGRRGEQLDEDKDDEDDEDDW